MTKDMIGDERWAKIEKTSNYSVSDYGRIRNDKTGRLMAQKKMDRQGHLGVTLNDHGNKLYSYTHRLVAEAFLSEFNQNDVVRHYDDDKTNNHISNLCLGTQKDNIHDAMDNGTFYSFTDEDRERSYEKTRTPIVATNLETKEELYFKSQSEAERVLGISQSNIWKVLSGERRQTSGYIFRRV